MRITIDNLPPIASGSFDLRPLTIFIGPNNTGKTRAGLLVYAFARALDTTFKSGLFQQFPAPYLREEPAVSYDTQQSQIVDALLDHVTQIADDVLPELLQALIGWTRTEQVTGRSLVRFTDDRNESLAVGIDLDGDLIRRPFENRDHLVAEWDRFRSLSDRAWADERGEPLDASFWRTLRRNQRLPGGAALYLPAGRGAFAESWGFLTGVALDRFGADSAATALSQRVRDYLRLLLNAAYLHVIAKPGDFTLMNAVDLIEREILNGRVTAGGNPSVPFPLIFSNIFDADQDRFTIDLSQASSSVNEVGPIAMMLKSIVRPGDLVVVDEPEAHLHPENQRRIARVLVRLATAGVSVVAPTHSHTIIHEIGNMIRAVKIDEEKAQALGYGPADKINPEDVGVYVFRDQGHGVTIEEVLFDPEFGYPEETFFEVAQAQSLTSHQIDLATVVSGAE